MRYWVLIIFLTGCATTSTQQIEAEWCFICWTLKANQDIEKNEKVNDCTGSNDGVTLHAN